MGDGAVWIWNTGDHHFPHAIQIVDLYHAFGAFEEVTHLCFPRMTQAAGS
jgi:hypothetical protein